MAATPAWEVWPGERREFLAPRAPELSFVRYEALRFRRLPALEVMMTPVLTSWVIGYGSGYHLIPSSGGGNPE